MSDMENKDWLNEFPELKKVNPKNPFTVPEGYFHELYARTLSLKNISVENHGFTVPANYFDEMEGNLRSRIAVAEAINVENTGFTVPEGYFDELTGSIQSRIAIDAAAKQETAGFEVPQGYFENLQQQISARIAVDEALAAQPEEAFAVPDGYFDKLNAAILDKTVNADQQTAVKPAQRSIVRRLFNSNVYKYAAAACVTVVVAVSFILSSNSNSVKPHQDTYLHSRLAEIPVNEIKSYVEQNLDAGETQTIITEGVDNLSDEEILDLIDTEL